MDSIRGVLTSALDAVRLRPVTTVVVTNALTAAAFVYVLSDGKPGKLLYKLIFNAALAAVPASIKDKQLSDIRSSIERDVVGTSLDGDDVQLQLPPLGMKRRASSQLAARLLFRMCRRSRGLSVKSAGSRNILGGIELLRFSHESRLQGCLGAMSSQNWSSTMQKTANCGRTAASLVVSTTGATTSLR